MFTIIRAIFMTLVHDPEVQEAAAKVAKKTTKVASHHTMPAAKKTVRKVKR